jgi:hypothetical protein
MPTITFTNASGTFTYEENVTPPDPNPEPPDGDWQPPSYLRTDTRAETTPDISKPDYLTPFTDPVFKTKLVRITGDPGTEIGSLGKDWPDVARHHYNSDQAWNCDQSLIYLDKPGVFLDGETYQPLFMANGIPSDSDVRWWTQPNTMIYAAGSVLGTWNPKTGTKTTIKNFGVDYAGLKFGPWEGSPSEDGDMVVLSYDGGGFAYKISTNKKYPDIRKEGVDNVRISPLGNYMIWGCEPDHVVVTDLQGNEVTDLPEDYVSHFDVCVDGDGEECIVGRNNESGPMTKYRMRDGRKTQLCSGGWCSHTSTRSLTHTWAVSAATNEDVPPYRGEVLMSNLDGSKTYRLGHTHEPATIDYRAETQPSHSPDAGRVIFASAWGGSGSEPRPVGCYVVDIRK